MIPFDAQGGHYMGRVGLPEGGVEPSETIKFLSKTAKNHIF
jgi:hypothetical protein